MRRHQDNWRVPHWVQQHLSFERNLFESSYATRLNRNMGLYLVLHSM
jgi:hypothetical protein